jgi:hypothetical protein
MAAKNARRINTPIRTNTARSTEVPIILPTIVSGAADAARHAVGKNAILCDIRGDINAPAQEPF